MYAAMEGCLSGSQPGMFVDHIYLECCNPEQVNLSLNVVVPLYTCRNMTSDQIYEFLFIVVLTEINRLENIQIRNVINNSKNEDLLDNGRSVETYMEQYGKKEDECVWEWEMGIHFRFERTCSDNMFQLLS